MSLNLASLLRYSATLNPTRTAIVMGDKKLPYAQVHGMAQRFGGALHRLGAAGHKVALMLPNVPHFSFAYFGAHYAACPVVPLNVLLTADEIAYHLEDSDAAVRALRERFDAETLPVIALTAAALTSERDEAMAAGMNDFLTKPIDVARLRETLARYLRRTAAA